MTSAQDAAIRELLCRCFPADVEDFSRSRPWHGSAPEYTLVHWGEGQVAGHVAIVLREIRVAARERVFVAGVQSLAVATALRKTGLSQQLMIEAMSEAARRGAKFGLLFCLPELERFYGSLGWQRTDARVMMSDAQGRHVPIPAKNITMFKPLGVAPFPEGEIDLGGADW